MKNISLSTFVANFENNKYNSSIDSMCDAGWYDWFCKDSGLYKRFLRMIPCVKAAAKSPLINPDEVYVFFKNNCPISGPLYDSFSICDLKRGDVKYWITLKSGHTGEAEILVAPDFENNALPEGKRGANEIKKFFANK